MVSLRQEVWPSKAANSYLATPEDFWLLQKHLDRIGWRVRSKPYIKAMKLAYENSIFKEEKLENLQHSDM